MIIEVPDNNMAIVGARRHQERTATLTDARDLDKNNDNRLQLYIINT